MTSGKKQGGVPDVFLDELRAIVKVSRVAETVGVQLKRAGHEFKALSPFNEENSPSFTINDGKALWKCFSSGKGGDVFDLVMETRGASFRDAVKYVADLAGREVPGGTGRSMGGNKKMDRAPARTEDTGFPEDRGGGAPFDDSIGHMGTDAPPRPKAEKKAPAKREIVKAYDYLDEGGALVYQVVRFEPKGFSQRRPAPGEPGKWIWGLTKGTYVRKKGGDWLVGGGDRTPDKGFVESREFPDTPHGLYRFPKILDELAVDAAERESIWLPEGEKDVETLESWGLLATTNSGGAKNWRPDHAELFRDCDVIVPLDGDKPGRERGELIAQSLFGIAKRVRLLELPPVEDAHGLVKKGSDVTDWKEAGHDKGELLKIVAKLPAWAAAPPEDYKSKFGAIPMSRLWDEAEEYRWLIKGVLPCSERVLIYGEPQSGKSFFALDMALHVARGESFRKLRTAQAGVVYCAFEGGKGFRNRVKGYFLGHEIKPDDSTPFVILTRDADLFGSEDVVKDMIAEIQHWASTFSVPLGLIVFDTISACTPGMNENAGEEIGRFLGHARQIGAETGATIMLVHHKPKQGDTPRGSGKLTGDLETTIEVGFPVDGAHDENNRPIRIMKVKKQREGEAGKEFRFTLKKIEVATDRDGDPITTCIVEPPGGVERVGAAKGFQLRPGNETMFFQAVWMALRTHGETPPPGLVGATGHGPPPGVKVVQGAEVKKAYMMLDVGHPDDDEEKALARVAKTFQRELPKLRKYGVLDSMRPFIWWTGKPIRDMPETFSTGVMPPVLSDDDGNEASTVTDPFEGVDYSPI